MKYFGAALILAGLGFLPTAGLFAQGEPSNPSASPAESGSGSTLKRDVLVLVRAKISDPVILSYIRKNAGSGQRATSQDMIDLKQAGASDAVLTAFAEATAATPGRAAPSDSSGGPSTTASPESSSISLYPSSGYPYGYSTDGYWPYYPYGYYGYPYYGYGYPYWGFGVSVPFFFHGHDGHFHHDDHFHNGHFHGGTTAPHGGFVSHGGGGHGGGGHGGGGHR